jgi:hypothetical protein
MKHHTVPRTILAMTVVAMFALVGCAQQSAHAPSGGVGRLEGTQVTVKGTIGYMKSARTYIVQGETPPGEYFVVNENPQVLDELMKRGKTVTIEGHYTIGADHLFIESIDGKVYRGKE